MCRHGMRPIHTVCVPRALGATRCPSVVVFCSEKGASARTSCLAARTAATVSSRCEPPGSRRHLNGLSCHSQQGRAWCLSLPGSLKARSPRMHPSPSAAHPVACADGRVARVGALPAHDVRREGRAPSLPMPETLAGRPRRASKGLRGQPTRGWPAQAERVEARQGYGPGCRPEWRRARCASVRSPAAHSRPVEGSGTSGSSAPLADSRSQPLPVAVSPGINSKV